uniref:BTB domain-containing protein n=1 Tax=Haemonchus contortus TaxID=6289 RepID=A0A7I5E8I5_HAECO
MSINMMSWSAPGSNSNCAREVEQTKKGELLTLVPKRTRCAVSMRADDTDKWGNDTLDERDDYQLVLKDASIKDELLNRLNTFRCNRELCDIVLFVREKEIFAHKVVLAAVSPALFDMFLKDNEEESRSSPNETTENGHEAGPQFTTTLTVAPSTKKPMAYFDFTQTDYECFEALVNFAYTACLEISSKKVAELYKTAFALQMTPVVKACAQFLADNLNLKNCIGIRRQANFNDDKYLLSKVDAFIQENFEKIVNDSVEFTQLPCIKTRIIVPKEDGRRPSSLEKGALLAQSALDYFNRIPHDRVEHSIEKLIHKTSLLYMEDDQRLTDCAEIDDKSSVGSCDIIQDYKKSGKEVAKAMTNGSMDSSFTAPVQHRVTGAVPVRLNASRVPNVRYSSTESLNSLDSAESDPQDTIETGLIATHQTSADYWVALAVLYRRLVVLSIQLTDDEDITKSKSNGSGMDPQKNLLLSRLISCTGSQRRPLATMNGARCSIGASFLNGKIIVCGGYDRGECLRSVEEYDVVRGEWRQLQSMNDERGRFDSAVLNGKVYAVAGSNGNHDLKTAEVYNPKTNQWTAIPSLNKARSHNGCAALDGFLYCVGGSLDQQVLKDCERFDESRQVWEPIASMELGRFQAGVIAWRGLVVACGGCDRWNCMDSVEAYDPKTNKWRMLAKMRTARRGCAVAVIRDTLYVIGGHDGQQSLSSVEVLEHPAASWRPGPPLTTPRANTHAVVTAGNAIYAIGGFNGNQFLNSIELMDSELVGWRNWQLVSDPVPLTEEEEEVEPNSPVVSTTPDSIKAQSAVKVT